MDEVKPLIRGLCPVCQKIIMNSIKSEYINGGKEFWVRFSDGSRAQFSICSDCLENITQEQLGSIMQRQRISWGLEIQAQLDWYVKSVSGMSIIKYANTKEELG